MRLSFVLLATAVALAVRCDATLTTPDATQMKFSKLASQDLAQTNSNENRFLRGGKAIDEDDDEYEHNKNLENEERGGKTWAQKFAKWHANKETADDVYQRFALEPAVRQAYRYGSIKDLDNNPYYRKWAAYSAFLKGLE
ncbi:hypothetical protein PRNP1_010919 [Phytophthora ramorum]